MTAHTSQSHTKLGSIGLLVLLAGQLLPQIDFSIVNVALDAISHTFHASETELELIVAVYGVAFAVCLAMGGRLGDNFGRRKLFLWGVQIFGVASLLCGLAGSIWMLLAARVLQGIGAALIVPQILATIHVGLTGHDHSRALGYYGAIGGLAFIVGQVLGGFLVSADIAGLGWRSVFLINLPICIGLLLATPKWIPETRRSITVDIDLIGTALLAMVIICLLLPLALGPVMHWSWPYLLMLMAVLPLLAILWKVELGLEKRGAHPLLPPALLRIPSTRFGLLIAVLFFSSWSGYMFALALTLQSGAGLSALHAGNAFVAMGAMYFIVSLLSARVVKRIGRVPTLMLGCAIQMSGLLGLMLTLKLVWPHPDAFHLIPATILIGGGQALIVSCFFRIGLSDVPTEQAGAGGSMLSTVQQASFGLGSALLGAVLTQTLHFDGSYLHAAVAALGAEFCIMLGLLISAAVYYRRHKKKHQTEATTQAR
ncbi:MAG TPA: MFS transporter [Oxalicibacterium sp.]|uniref:MFS transporter n=1 Tax=Oxalicibacterium sp. TaxID=2766525 RepID=UPI002CAFE78D|nr:MFS transporter [Oxalicibacterium sp.]HWU98140.1 MFS transporter [Oxalicibacterium sp.]